ncbi:hypothetical protein J2X31_003644 [Flavobacterium arsenatis]|uniref:Permease n=1 Tax=Flavobacterium arsenatis TaxID=1484332 RepID=A0ABU1TUR7_9FLAO|nr:hypothetical protein [Flavobacterium arsenatis]MDR6969611.1 hypothetical protein [Flavobacterium arsenatis]
MKSVFSGILGLVAMVVFCSIFMLIFFNQFIVPVFPVIVAVVVYFLTKTQRILIKKKYIPINQLSEGLVKIEGKINASTTLETPYFKDQCIGYSYEKAEIDYDDETGNEYTKSAVLKNNFQEFYISDATGKIKVNPEGLNLTFLTGKSKVISKTRHTERTLKNDDEITILANAVKNKWNEFELQKSDGNPFTISDKTNISKQEKSFQIIKLLLPYLVLMYVGVNYFLFTPIEIQIEQNEIFPYFAIFGMPILAIILGLIGSRFEGFANLILSNLAGTCFIVALLTIPLLCLFLMIEIEFYRIICIWTTIFVCTTIAFVMNFKRLDGLFEKDEK